MSVHKIPLERSEMVEKAHFTYIWSYRDLDLEVKVIKPCAEHPRVQDAYLCQILDRNVQKIPLERSGIVEKANLF